jgi:hypothetical protein
MGIYSAVKTNYFSGVVTITSTDSTPYAEIQTSMGSIQYQIKELYLYSTNATQILQTLTQKEYNVNGNIRNIIESPVINPYQYQNSLYYIPTKEVVLNGNSNISFEILPNVTLRLIFYVKQLANSMLLKEPSMFQEYFYKQQYEFFGGFKDEL